MQLRGTSKCVILSLKSPSHPSSQVMCLASYEFESLAFLSLSKLLVSLTQTAGQLGSIWTRGQRATIYFVSIDPLDVITFEIHDQDGNVVHTIATDAPASAGNYTLQVPYQAPPSDCYSCFLVAISNTYPENYHTVSRFVVYCTAPQTSSFLLTVMSLL